MRREVRAIDLNMMVSAQDGVGWKIAKIFFG
jgi:hypothetical protein